MGTCVCMQKSWDNFEGAQSVSWGVHAVPGKLSQGMMAGACRGQPREKECRKLDGEQTCACEMLNESSREKKASLVSCFAHASLHGNEDKQACWALVMGSNSTLEMSPKKRF